MSDLKTATLVVTRGVGEALSHEQSFEVPFEDGASVLDGLIWIRENSDPTLAFRFSCISANVCKECVISIDGTRDYACTSKLQSGTTQLAPLPNKVRLRDLACDTVPKKEKVG